MAPDLIFKTSLLLNTAVQISKYSDTIPHLEPVTLKTLGGGRHNFSVRQIKNRLKSIIIPV